MKRAAGKIAGYAAGVSLALLCVHSEARAHGCSTASAWEGISSNILEQSCFTGCHGSSGNGGMSVSYDTDAAWYAALVNRAPVNTAAGGFGKLRVDPKRPWNSYVLDKLTGDLKFGEGNPIRGHCARGRIGADRRGARHEPLPDARRRRCRSADHAEPAARDPAVDPERLLGRPGALHQHHHGIGLRERPSGVIGDQPGAA